MIILPAMIFCFRVVSTAMIPSLFGMFVCKGWASIVTRMLFSETLSKLLIFRLKFVELLTYDLSSFTCGCNTWSIYFNIFVVWQTTEVVTGLPGFPFCKFSEISWIVVVLLLNFLGYKLLSCLSKSTNVFNCSILVLTLFLFSSVVSLGNFL